MILAVAGGKGGTGKTVVALNLALTISKITNREVLVVDMDVDNPCTYTIVRAERRAGKRVYAFIPSINWNLCKLCGVCAEKCPAHALAIIPGKKLIFFDVLCEGCGTCLYVCPVKAIERGEKEIGKVYEATYGKLRLIIGELNPGDRRYHEVMEETLNYSKKFWSNYPHVIIDSPPGTGVGIKMILKEADLTIAVTEPTRLGLHDLKKLYSLSKAIEKPVHVVVNKAGLMGGLESELTTFLESKNLKFSKIPFDYNLVKSYITGKPIVESHPNSPSAKAITEIAKVLINA